MKWSRWLLITGAICILVAVWMPYSMDWWSARIGITGVLLVITGMLTAFFEEIR